ncbi:hypothetical protein MMC06_005355 [Schaereria dolodes]|nr:hypothetical protein [Schaereria dolodes]
MSFTHPEQCHFKDIVQATEIDLNILLVNYWAVTKGFPVARIASGKPLCRWLNDLVLRLPQRNWSPTDAQANIGQLPQELKDDILEKLIEIHVLPGKLFAATDR